MPAVALKNEIEKNKPEVELGPFLARLKKELDLAVRNSDKSNRHLS